MGQQASPFLLGLRGRASPCSSVSQVRVTRPGQPGPPAPEQRGGGGSAGRTPWLGPRRRTPSSEGTPAVSVSIKPPVPVPSKCPSCLCGPRCVRVPGWGAVLAATWGRAPTESARTRDGLRTSGPQRPRRSGTWIPRAQAADGGRRAETVPTSTTFSPVRQPLLAARPPLPLLGGGRASSASPAHSPRSGKGRHHSGDVTCGGPGL